MDEGSRVELWLARDPLKEEVWELGTDSVSDMSALGGSDGVADIDYRPKIGPVSAMANWSA